MKYVLAFLGMVLAGAGAWGQEAVVHKTAEPFESEAWTIGQYSRAPGTAALVEGGAEGVAASKQCLAVEARFGGGGFEFFNAGPRTPLVIPGDIKRVSMHARKDGDTDWIVTFQDAWGRTEAGGKKFEWVLGKDLGAAWKTFTFNVPADWPRPITITGVATHNWGAQDRKQTSKLWLDQLEIDTDISGVDPQTGVLKTYQADPAAKEPRPVPITPLLVATFSTPAEHNVFTEADAEKPAFVFHAQSWKPGAAKGELTWRVTDSQSRALRGGKKELVVEDQIEFRQPILADHFALYLVEAEMKWEGGKVTKAAMPVAYIPAPVKLTEAEKDQSPYGLNVLGARGAMVSTFRKAGIIWYRDYGFDFSWMVRAKGADKSYGGWPWYPKIVPMYDDVRLLACLKTAIREPGPNGMVEPDRTWTTEMASILTAFPQIKYFELDNEYDLNHSHAVKEEACGWANYRNYHRKFGELAKVLGAGQITAVENGRAGIHPERIEQCVAAGGFENIGVVNSHHYTGVDAPEVNVINANTDGGGGGGGQTEGPPRLFFDQLRAAKAAGNRDRSRQHWLTEFGWDTLAGPVVSPQQQAAYLQRGYMLALAAGTEKAFWFFDLDSPNPKQIFDGCGLVTDRQEPKLSYCAMAGLAHVLPCPQFVGMISAGPGTGGYLFRDHGKLVAALFSIEGQAGPKVSLEAEQIVDYLGNPVAGKEVPLGMAPVYAVGVSRESLWFKQSAYTVLTPYLMAVAAGDTATIDMQVINGRDTRIDGQLTLTVPQGWEASMAKSAATAAAGQGGQSHLSFRVGPNEPLGEKSVTVTVTEGSETIEVIPLRVRVQEALALSVGPLGSRPGEATVPIRVSNRSAKPLGGTLALELPAGWKTPTPEIKIEPLKPQETRVVSAKVTWTADWKPNEHAAAKFTSADGRTVQRPLIPGALTIHRVGKMAVDGNLAHWPEACKMPEWVLGSTGAKANAQVYMGWSEEGLRLAAKVADSKAIVPDPKSFWVGDVLELFVDTQDAKTARAYGADDHQFWLAPLTDAKRAYVGRWKRGKEIAETQYDIPGIATAVVRTDDGYILEALVPAAMLHGYRPQVGKSLGLGLNLSVRGTRQDREVYWPRPKAEGTADHPDFWGSAVLGE